MADVRTCPRCGSELPARAPEGLCPRCLLGAGLASDALSVDRAGDVGATVSLNGSRGVLETMSATLGAVPRVLLRDTDAGLDPPLVRPDRGTCDDSSRYRIDGEIARGGMGSVLKGRDPDLGRDVAIKVLREDLRGNADMVRRFVEEAQIGGQLQHPGIVPIYELGAFADRRPFFSMKLVKGHTLAGLLADRGHPSDGLPRFLAIFESIAQTVAYAHARGVIHRDLKPSNVMVGSFGEVQVMDWGLAKVLPRGGVVDDASAGKPDREETVIATARSGSDDSDLSHAGSAMGTPSYMAPEQARGEIERVDERADVFALGSILCEVLTGRPAFTGRSSGEIQRKAALGDLADALHRLDDSGADADLVGMAKECLAREPEDRPRSAGAVADRVTAYLAGVQEKLRRAELEGVEERARRRTTTVTAAAVILLGLAGGGGYVWNQRQRAERVARTARGVDEALADAARLRGEAQAAPPGEAGRWAVALSAAKRAQGLLAQGEADAPLKGRVDALLAQLETDRAAAADKARRLEADRALLANLETARGRRAEYVDLKRADAEYAAAFVKAGLDLDGSAPAESAKWLASRSDPMELAGYLDDWAHLRRKDNRAEADWRRLVEAARAADPDPWRDALRARVASNGAAAAAELRRLADDEKALDIQPAPSLILLARQLKDDIGDRERAAGILRRAVFRHPGEFWAQIELSNVHGLDSGTAQEMYPRPEETVRHSTAAVAIRPGSPMAHRALGIALHALGKFDEAVAEYREAMRLKPDYYKTHVSLAIGLSAQGKLDEAIAEYREAMRLKPDDEWAHIGLGGLFVNRGMSNEAAAEYLEASRIKPESALARNMLGRARYLQKRYDEAIAAYREVIRLDPGDGGWYHNLGDALRGQGKLDEAVVAYRDAIRLKPDLATAYNGLGLALKAQKKTDEAIAAYRDSIRLDPHDALAHGNLGHALRDKGKLDEAVAAYREAIRLTPDLATAHNGLGNALWDQKKKGEAAAAYREAIRVRPDEPWAHDGLGNALRDQGKLDEAVAEYRESIRLNPDYGYAHGGLGNALRDQGKLDEAVAEYRESIRLNPDNAWAHTNLGIVLAGQGKLDEAAAEHGEAIRLKPDNALAHNNLADCLKEGGDLDPAMRSIGEALRLDPENGFSRGTLAEILLLRSQFAEAIPALERAAERLAATGQGKMAGTYKGLVPKARRLAGHGEVLKTPGGKETTALELAARASERGRPALATRLYEVFLAASPARADDLKAGHRHAAACAAALAGSGGGQDDPRPDDAERGEFRRLALDWLKTDLAARSRRLKTEPKAGPGVRTALEAWREDADLAGVRDPAAMAKLPEAERNEWRALWVDVDALIKNGEGTKQ
jgi:eukaryotic-like serine/threonine-protein kinase